MDRTDIKCLLAEINEIIGRENDGNKLSEIEKDLLLQKLRDIYQFIKFDDGCGGVSHDDRESAPSDAGPSFPVREPAPEQHQATDAGYAPEPHADLEIIRKSADIEDGRFSEYAASENEGERGTRMDQTRKTLLSLYDAPVEKAHDTEAGGPDKAFRNDVSQNIKHEQQNKVLGEVMGNGEQTIGDAYAAHNNDTDVASVISSGHVESLRSAIGVNDKFVMVRDMFGGDQAACELAIDKFESFGSLEDAMLYMYDNYNWDPDAEGVRILVDLLTRKLS